MVIGGRIRRCAACDGQVCQPGSRAALLRRRERSTAGERSEHRSGAWFARDDEVGGLGARFARRGASQHTGWRTRVAGSRTDNPCRCATREPRSTHATHPLSPPARPDVSRGGWSGCSGGCKDHAHRRRFRAARGMICGPRYERFGSCGQPRGRQTLDRQPVAGWVQPWARSSATRAFS
jgi:hypothetical protein